MKSQDSDRDARLTPAAPPGAVDPARVEQVFHAAVELDTADRAAFVALMSADDPRLEAAVRRLLAAERATTSSWDGSALEVEARHSALAAQPRQGDRFGPYRIVRRIAAGGMGLVCEAVRDDAEFHKRVAIKFVQHGAGDAAAVERFRSERQILAELEHPNIARLLDGGTADDGTPYLVMEYVDGVPIDRYAAEQRLSRTRRLRLFLLVCDAVQYAHRNLVVHRDLKAANILVTAEGVPKLLDFGIAKLLSSDTHATTVHALTPAYASPEQVLGKSVGTPSDVYSLGVLLFVLLAERLPYRGSATATADLVRGICEEAPVWRPAGLIDADLRSILAQALRKEPGRRYSSVDQMRGDVQRYLGGLPVSARADSFGYRARKFLVRRWVPVAAACAVVAAVIAGTLSTLAQSRRAERRFNEVRTLAHSVLFDVYDAISPLPGSVSARRLVASRAQQYLDSLAREAGNDASLERELAESYLRLGDVRGKPYRPNLGETAGALESYQKGLALLERNSARHPDDPAIGEELAQAYMNIGVIFMRQQKADDSIAAAKRAIALVDGLLRRDPRNATLIEELSTAYLRLGQAQGIVADRSGSVADTEQVLATYRKAVAVLQTEEPLNSSGESRLSGLYFYVGYALRNLGDRSGTVDYYKDALDSALKGDAINRRLLGNDPADAGYIRKVADGLASIGPLRWKCCRDLNGALHDQQAAIDIFQRTVDGDPQNLEARRDLAGTYKVLGWILEEAGHRSDALGADRKALAAFEDVARSDPTSAEDAGYIADLRMRVAALNAAR